MSRHDELKQLDIKSRNQLRNILASSGTDTIARLNRLRSGLGKRQVQALENILSSPKPIKAATRSAPFPQTPPFGDALRGLGTSDLDSLLASVNRVIKTYEKRISNQIFSLQAIDEALSQNGMCISSKILIEHIGEFGWSHAILRRIVLIRENLKSEDDEIESLVWNAGLETNSLVVTSLIHAYAAEQNYLTTKRSTLNVADRGSINRYSRTLSRITFQPFARDGEDLFALLKEVAKCSLIDTLILIKFNSHYIKLENFDFIHQSCAILGHDSIASKLIAHYPNTDSDSESLFFQQCGVWLEYPMIRSYRILVDNFYDASRDVIEPLFAELQDSLGQWVGTPDVRAIASANPLTCHGYDALSKLEISGSVTRSALFNYWLHITEGQIGFNKDELLRVMELTRDLSRTVPIEATRLAAKLALEPDVKLILLLLLAKRSKNEKDSFQLRRLVERLSLQNHNGSLVEFVNSFHAEHPNIAAYIYEVATEDFLAKCTSLAPHLMDIPELRAQLHEWKAKVTENDYYIERARAVRIDHQLNRVRNEIDDHRIYVDPSRFASWINDEVMVDLNSALTVTGANKKNATITCDETLLSSLVRQCYSAFCSNAVFGISSYIGRRIRHGTFRGHLYSGVVNHLEKLEKFSDLRRDAAFSSRWSRWKERYDQEIGQIINDRLHVVSKQKPLALLQPDNYNPHKTEIIAASVRTISATYTETKSTDGLDQVITDYCWRLAESDLFIVTTYLKSRQTVLKNVGELDEIVSSVFAFNRRSAAEFKREVIHVIDNKLRAMYGWFKRPSSISAKASLALLYNAVVAEVKDTFPDFDPSTQSTDLDDIELIGGAYHNLYDSFYVVVFNAAKHGHPSRGVRRRFSISVEDNEKRIQIEIANAIHPRDSAEEVANIIQQRRCANHEDANLYERRSGIPKLMQLANTCREFNLEFLGIVENEVVVRFSYALEH